MKITRWSPYSKTNNILDLPITQEQYDAWMKGTLIQKAMPNITDDEREFILSGYLPGEFEKAFGQEREDD